MLQLLLLSIVLFITTVTPLAIGSGLGYLFLLQFLPDLAAAYSAGAIGAISSIACLSFILYRALG